jgi:hypothetical protein
MQPKPIMDSNSEIVKTTPRLADLMLTLYSQGLVNIFIVGKAIAPGIFHAIAVEELVRPQVPVNGLMSVVTTNETPWLAEALEKELGEKNKRVIVRTIQTMEIVMVVDIPTSNLHQVAYSRLPQYPMLNGDMMRPVQVPMPGGPLQGFQRGEMVMQMAGSPIQTSAKVPTISPLLEAYVSQIDNNQSPLGDVWALTKEGKLYQNGKLMGTFNNLKTDLHQAIEKLMPSIPFPSMFISWHGMDYVRDTFKDFYVGEFLAQMIAMHQLTTAQHSPTCSINVSYLIHNFVSKEGLYEKLLSVISTTSTFTMICGNNNTINITVKQ